MLIADVVNCMNEEELKKSWDKFEPRFNISIENLIIGLFEEYREPFFDKIKIKSELINKFSKDKRKSIKTKAFLCVFFAPLPLCPFAPSRWIFDIFTSSEFSRMGWSACCLNVRGAADKR